ncbi:hypothetical protein Q8F55_001203 [Vanrija albida]|uniref:Extracellular metalloproteinase n=1 Tax=Vanrija albida TaxID=181172 RepID=A0ABR3QFF5_9TREE
MRPSALVALLPFLAVATAHGEHGKGRKSLSFGPHHAHARFEAFPDHVHKRAFTDSEPADARQVAAAFIAAKVGAGEGDGFYLRDDSYTDPTTLVTHVYARQLINGLEVGDGDINVNIDRNGRIISWGNSFHPGGADLSSGAIEQTVLCESIDKSINEHRAALKETVADEPSAWQLAKTAAKALLGFDSDEDEALSDEEIRHTRLKIGKNLRHVKNHKDALCAASAVSASEEGLSAAEALASLLGRISNSFVDPKSLESTPHHTLKPKHAPAEPPTEILSGDALAAANVVGDVPARLMYTQSSEGSPRLVYKLEVEMKDNWYEAYVDVITGNIVRMVDWAADASDHFAHKIEARKAKAAKDKGGKQKPLPSPKEPKFEYAVFPWGVNDPTEGKVKTVTKPWDNVASPLGWHSYITASNPWPQARFKGAHVKGNTTTVASTVGNNVLAHEDWEGRNDFLDNWRPVSDDFSFVYEYGEPDGLAPKEYIDFVVTQLFYTCNAYHDLLYRLGFDEVSGNFQMYNFGKGGKGGDPVIANAQDGSGYNNANFMTPPDGQAPRMRMYVWDTATPYRDGDLEAGIVIHEYSHGLSTRLTGGPANSGCLGWGEAGGMGEGWGDAIATIIRQVEEHGKFKNGTDVYPMGAWAANQPGGIRNYVYSTNSTVNPSTYKTLDKPGYWGVHAIGEVWAEYLFVLTTRLIAEYGFSSTLYPPEDTSKPNDYYTKTSGESVDSLGRPQPLIPKHGNTLSLQLIISAMKLQPCRPTFFDARDAIIQADELLTGGANQCIIWKAFAERGLGSDAAVVGQTPWGGGVRTDGFKVPTKACN